MEITTRKTGDVLIASVKGRLDAVTSQEFDKGMSQFLTQGEKAIVINFSQLEYISSAGLRSILSAAKQLKAKDGKILFAGLTGPVKDVFEISGFYTIFKVFDSEEEALSQA
jgi:anti-anti-sigma factor